MTPTSGSGTMTPIGGGIGTGASIAQPLPYTLLSLDRYAKVMGINPAHFWGASSPNTDPQVMPISATCSSVWFKYDWQDSDRVGRYTIAQEIANAENDIARAIGYWPAPMWITEEHVPYPRYHRPEYFSFGADIRGRFKSINARWGRISNVGKRAVSLIGSATVGGGTLSYTDEDSDGMYETATVVLPTSLLDASEIKVYHYGKNGEPGWEIREPRSKRISGGFVRIVFDSWLFINPDIYEFLPTSDGNSLVDLGKTDSLVNAVDVYREHVDQDDAAVEFYWNPDYTGCNESEAACEEITQSGCLRIYNSKVGTLVAVPASYNTSEGKWEISNGWNGEREPDYVKIHYVSGEPSQEYLRRFSLSPLSDYWAQTIAWLATARLPRPMCSCGNLEALTAWLMTNLSENTRERSFFNTPSDINNPFGTRGGEVAAWRRISKLIEKRSFVALA